MKSYVISLIVSGKNKQYRASGERMGFLLFSNPTARSLPALLQAGPCPAPVSPANTGTGLDQS